MATIDEQIAQLEITLADGVQSVKHGDILLWNADKEKIIAALNYLRAKKERDAAAAAGAKSGNRYSLARWL